MSAGKQTYPAMNVNNSERPSSFEKLPSNQFSSQLSEMTKLGRVENMPFEFFLVVSVFFVVFSCCRKETLFRPQCAIERPF